MNIGLVGATGFVGSHVAMALNERSVEWRPVPRIDPSLADRDIAECLQGFDCVINCAGRARAGSREDPEMTFANSHLPAALMRSADVAGVRHFVHVSTAAVQGRRRVLDETTAHSPLTPYGRSKADGEAAVFELASRSKIALTVYRPTSVQGDQQPSTESLRRLLESPRLARLAINRNAKIPLSHIATMSSNLVRLTTTAEHDVRVVLQPWEWVTGSLLLDVANSRLDGSGLANNALSVAIRGAGALPSIPPVIAKIRSVELLCLGQEQNAPNGLRLGLQPGREQSTQLFRRLLLCDD